ncbi:MAG: hypothetical protein ACP5XB_18895, partial [Isosphaeraceae bacterium]
RILASLVHLPTYAIWKLATVLHGRPTRWIRTARVDTAPAPAEDLDCPAVVASTRSRTSEKG